MNRSKQNFNPSRHHRQSLRLKNYDYASAGLYFVTICTKNKECLFGEVTKSVMVYNEAGSVADFFWRSIPDHFPSAVLHEYIVMPNHIHGIIELHPSEHASKEERHEFQKMIPKSISAIIKGFKIGVTKWFRYGRNNSSTNFWGVGVENLQPLHPKNTAEYPPIWQRSFHDHIIRNEQEYVRISNYIINNPKKWEQDKFYPTL